MRRSKFDAAGVAKEFVSQNLERDEEILRIYVSGLLTTSQIGKIYGLTRERIRQILEGSRGKVKRENKNRILPDEQEIAAKIEELYNEGMYIEKIAKTLQIPDVNRVLDILKVLNAIKHRTEAIQFKNVLPEEEAALNKKIKALQDGGKPVTEIAVEVELHPITVFYFLRKIAAGEVRANKVRQREMLKNKRIELDKTINEKRRQGENINQITAELGLIPGSIRHAYHTGQPTEYAIKRRYVPAIMAAQDDAAAQAR